MKDKEKQIKNKQINDLANTLYNRQDKYDLSNPFEVAKCVIDLGYRKLPEDSVVLSREEICELKCQAEEDFNKAYDLGSNETAEKIFKAVKELIDQTDQICDNPYNREIVWGYITTQIDNGLWELAKQFNVEIKE